MADTSKIERVYSPVLDLASAIGRKPATVTSVPVSIGNAVLVYANAAARMRIQPCSIFTAIISTAMIASSTSRPSASTSVPSETLCRPMSNRYMHRARDREHQRNRDHDHHAGAHAERQEAHEQHDRDRFGDRFEESSTERATACGMLDTSTRCSPAGSAARSAATCRSSALPSWITSPPGCIVTPMPSTGLPPKRICVARRVVDSRA